MDPALELMHDEGWGFVAGDVQRLIDVSDGGFFGAFDGDQLVGSTLALPQGPVGWIGNVLVAASARGRGIGTDLVERGIAHLDKAGCRTIKLYATPRATALYERLGFTGESEVLMVTGRAGPRHPRGTVVGLDDVDWDAVLEMDATATGADRGRMLRRLADDFPELAFAALARDGTPAAYGMARTAGGTGEIGPVVGRLGAPSAIDAVVDSLLDALGDVPVEAAVPRTGPGAESVRCRGFEVASVGLEMRRGPREGRDLAMIAAAAGQEKG